MTGKDIRPLRERRDEFERNIIVETLEEHGGSVRRAARALKMSRTGLYKRIRLLGIKIAAAEADETVAGDDGEHD